MGEACWLRWTVQKHAGYYRSRRRVAERSYPLAKVRGGHRECQAASAQERPRGATPQPRSVAAAEISYHTPEVRTAVKTSYSTFKVRRGGREEIPLVQGKEQQLHFPGAAVKRYPTSKVRETQVRR